MELLELSVEKLKEENNKLYSKIVDYDYDLVIFIARGSYQIGKDLSELKGVPLIEIFATRNGGKFKKMIRPVLKILPNKLKSFLRKKEFNSNYHEVNANRKISYEKSIWEKYKNSRKILLVDDSIDTGYSVKFAKKSISEFFENSEVRVACLNYFDKSKKVVSADYYLYNEKMLLGPWSNDSSDNKKYLKNYEEWHESQN